MSEDERKLLLWCAILHVRETPLSADEADEIDELINRVRDQLTIGLVADKTDLERRLDKIVD